MKKTIILLIMISLLFISLQGCLFFGESIGDSVPVIDFVDLEKNILCSGAHRIRIYP